MLTFDLPLFRSLRHSAVPQFLRRAVRGFQRAHVLGGALTKWAQTARAQKAKRRAINLVRMPI